jgi:membrane associated rhomboid family serine protease
MVGIMLSGVAFGLTGAMVVWGQGHHIAMIGLAYSISGMIGTLAFASIMQDRLDQGIDASH